MEAEMNLKSKIIYTIYIYTIYTTFTKHIIYIYMSYDIGIHSQVIEICMCYQGVKSRASKCFDKDYIHLYKSRSQSCPQFSQRIHPTSTI